MRILPHRGAVEAPPSRRRGTGAARARRFARDTRGAAGIELAFGAAALLGIAAAGFAVYSRIEAATSAPRIAIAMAEYVSREKAPDGHQLDALARFLRDHELGAGYSVLVVTTALRKEADNPATVLWIDRIEIGDETATEALKATCKGKGDGNGNAALGEHFTMDDDEIVFVVEVCARPATVSWTGDFHYHYLLPTRHPDVIPESPARTSEDESDGTSEDESA